MISTHLWAFLLINLDGLKSQIPRFPTRRVERILLTRFLWEFETIIRKHLTIGKWFNFYFSVKNRMTKTSFQDCYHSTYFLQPSYVFFFSSKKLLKSSVAFYTTSFPQNTNPIHFDFGVYFILNHYIIRFSERILGEFIYLE